MDTYKITCYNTYRKLYLLGGVWKKASVKYLEKLDEVRVRAEKGTKNRWKNAAASRGKSLNQFVVDAVEHEISVGTGKDSEAE